MTRAVVQNVGLHASSQVADKGALLVVVVAAAAAVAADSATVKLARCTTLPVPIVAMKHRYLFNREKIGLSIAMTATNRNVPIVQTTDDHAGNPHERDWAVLPSKP
jgi:hypothetical protein